MLAGEHPCQVIFLELETEINPHRKHFQAFPTKAHCQKIHRTGFKLLTHRQWRHRASHLKLISVCKTLHQKSSCTWKIVLGRSWTKPGNFIKQLSLAHCEHCLYVRGCVCMCLRERERKKESMCVLLRGKRTEANVSKLIYFGKQQSSLLAPQGFGLI